MTNLEIILVVGEIGINCTKKTVLQCFQDGLLSIPNFDSLKVNDVLSNISDPSDVPDRESQTFLYSSSEVNISVLQCPSVSLILDSFEKHFTSLPKQICLIYAGLICQSSGHWILPNSIFKPNFLIDRISLVASRTPHTLADGAKPPASINLHIACPSLASGGEWRHLSSHLPCIGGRSIVVTVNRHHHSGGKTAAVSKLSGMAGKPTAAIPEQAPIPTDISGVESFCHLLSTKLVESTVVPVCGASQKTPGSSIRINRPCLYVFPEGSGQSTIFALPGFSLMVNTGCSHDPKAWKMAQHLDNIDAIMQTHWGIDNIFGLTSLLPALMPADTVIQDGVPKVSCLLTPPPGGPQHLFSGILHPTTTESFNVNLVNEVSGLGEKIKSAVAAFRLIPMEVSRGAKLSSMPKPLLLFYKTGYGSLDLYPLTPTDDDQAEIRHLTELWNKAAPGFAAALSGAGATMASKTAAVSKMVTPLVSKLSISALLIWRPITGNKKIDESGLLRILFVAPNAHQARVLVALEGLHIGLPYIRQSVSFPVHEMSNASLAASKKPSSGASSRPLSGAGTARKMTTNTSTQRLAMGNGAVASKVPSKAAPTSSSSRPASLRTATGPSSQLKRPTAMASKAAAASSKLPANPKTTSAATAKNASSAKSSPRPSPAELTETSVTQPIAKVNGESEKNKTIGPWTPSNGDDPAPELNANGEVGVVNTLSEDNEEGDVNSVIDNSLLQIEKPMAEFPTDVTSTVNLVDDWALPQALPAPVPPAAKKASEALLASKQAPEGYFEASHVTGGPGKTPYDKLKATFVDVAFLPGGGDVRFVDAEWFKFVRARYYVCTTEAPTADLLKAMVVGKEAWTGEDKSMEVSLILAHDTNDLLLWASINEARLLGSKIDLLTVANRSTIQLMQAEGDKSSENVVCPGFRLDF